MTLHAYRNEENRTNRVVFLILARNSFDPFQTSHAINLIAIFFLSESKESRKLQLDYVAN
jgi:hypothetical protein